MWNRHWQKLHPHSEWESSLQTVLLQDLASVISKQLTDADHLIYLGGCITKVGRTLQNWMYVCPKLERHTLNWSTLSPTWHFTEIERVCVLSLNVLNSLAPLWDMDVCARRFSVVEVCVVLLGLDGMIRWAQCRLETDYWVLVQRILCQKQIDIRELTQLGHSL